MSIFFAVIYIIIGAGIGSFYYFLQLKRDYHDEDTFSAIWIGVLWPVAAPFAFGFYYARTVIEKERKR